MRKTFAPILAAVFAAALSLGIAAPAQAQESDAIMTACGANIGTGSSCEIKTSGGCTVACTPVNFTVQCAADLKIGCDAMCNVMIDVGCSAMCSADCSADCKVDPGKFECSASCEARCDAGCSGRCAASTDKAKCDASCKATCDSDCNAECKVTPPSADCTAKCDASCSGSCHADANMDCQVNCQADGYLKCETSLQGGCEAACSQPDGALFCDGQYIDVGNQLDACANALRDLLNIEVTGYAYADGQCSGTSCTATAEAGCSCSAVGRGSDPRETALGMLGAIAAFGLAMSRRKQASK